MYRTLKTMIFSLTLAAIALFPILDLSALGGRGGNRSGGNKRAAQGSRLGDRDLGGSNRFGDRRGDNRYGARYAQQYWRGNYGGYYAPTYGGYYAPMYGGGIGYPSTNYYSYGQYPGYDEGNTSPSSDYYNYPNTYMYGNFYSVQGYSYPENHQRY